MKTIAVHDQFHEWLLSTYNEPQASGKVHCFTVRKRVTLALGETVDFLSIRHDAFEDRETFSVGLWKFNVGAIDLEAVNEMCRHLQSFRSGCAEVVHRLEMKGDAGGQAIGVYGNLVGACVSPGPAIPLLANGFGDLAFWTYREGTRQIEVEPHYDESPAQRSQTRLFRNLFEFASCSGGRRKAKALPALAPA